MPKSKKIKAEEEIKEETVDLEKDEKDLDTKEVAEEATEKEDLIVLTDGATAEEHVKLDEEELDNLTKITKADGTEFFVETPEGSAEENKEVYEAIVEAETPAEEVAEDLEAEVNEEMPEVMEEIEEVGYVPAACHTAHASLNNSYYILKLKGGKLKALKAGKILNKELKASIIKAYKEGKQVPPAEDIFNKIASKVGYTLSAFTKLASKLANKKVVATELPDTVPGKEADKAEELKNFSIDETEIKKDNIDSEVALEKAELEEGKEGVKAAPSKVKSLYNRLPGKSGVGDEVEWSLKDFNKERNKADKTLASQIKALRDATKEIRTQKEVLASKEAEIKGLQEKLEAFSSKEQAMIKSAKIKKILASMNIEDDEEKAAMTEKFAKYSQEQLDAVYETMTACPAEEATIMHERMINEEMKKEASALEGFVPSFKMEEEVITSASDEMDALVLERELASMDK